MDWAKSGRFLAGPNRGRGGERVRRCRGLLSRQKHYFIVEKPRINRTALCSSRWKRSVGVVLGLGDCRAAAASWTSADSNQPIRVGICRRLWLAPDTPPQVQQGLQSPPDFRIGHKQFQIVCPSRKNHANNESTKSLELNGSRSPAFSPTPT